MIDLDVLRFSSKEDDTLSLIFENSFEEYGGREATPPGIPVKDFLCFGLEDEYREVKVANETRIPAGRYRILLREEGGRVNPKYERRFGSMHKGMLWLQDVPNFTWVYIHCGNKEGHTSACLLVGDTSQSNLTENGFIGASSAAYKRIYPPLAEAILAGEEVWINFIDYDTPIAPL